MFKNNKNKFNNINQTLTAFRGIFINKMSQRDNDNLNDEEELEISESEMEEGLDQMEKWRKCNNCNRPCNGH